MLQLAGGTSRHAGLPWRRTKLVAVRPDEGRSSDLTRGRFAESLIASDTSIEAALQPVKLYQGIRDEAATSAADLLSKPSAWISRAPAAAFRGERLRSGQSGRGCAGSSDRQHHFPQLRVLEVESRS